VISGPIPSPAISVASRAARSRQARRQTLHRARQSRPRIIALAARDGAHPILPMPRVDHDNGQLSDGQMARAPGRGPRRGGGLATRNTSPAGTRTYRRLIHQSAQGYR